jgi:translation initiation factor 2B subunit (eIF-2B alpha/beta/delta family)
MMQGARTRAYTAEVAAAGLPEPDATAADLLWKVLDGGVLGASRHVALAMELVVHQARLHPADARRLVGFSTDFIARTRGAEAPIVANALAWHLAGLDAVPKAEFAGRLAERAAAWEVEAAERRERLVAAAIARLADASRILAFDYSSTVAAILLARAAVTPPITVVVPESRAIDGGRAYVEELTAASISVQMVIDAAIDWALDGVDAVLLGAESTLADGAIVNTIGSTMTAKLAAARGIPVFACADLFKLDRRSYRGVRRIPEPRSFAALLSRTQPPPETGPYATAVSELEIVPAALLTAQLTEHGPVPPAAIWQLGRTVFGEDRS